MFYSAKSTLLSPKTQRGQIVILFMLIILGPQLCIDLYLPSMPFMQLFFHTSHTAIQYTLLFYLLGTGGTQFIYGPLIDKYGRRPILLFSLVLFFIASLGCVKTNTIGWFLGWRTVQGIADGGVFVIYRALLRDLYDGKGLSKIISYASIAWIISPIIAPLFGGYIQHFYGWRMNFIVIFVISAIILILAWRLFPETRHDIDPDTITEQSVAKNYLRVLKNPLFIFFALTAMLSNVIMLCYNLISPFLLQHSLHLTPVSFGWTAAFVACGYIIGSLANGKLVMHFKTKSLIYTATLFCCTGMLALFVLAFYHYFSVAAVIIPIAVTFIGIGILYPNCAATAMQPFKAISGTAGALQGTIQTGLGVLLGLSGTLIPHHNALAFSILCLAFTMLIVLIVIWTRRYEY